MVALTRGVHQRYDSPPLVRVVTETSLVPIVTLFVVVESPFVVVASSNTAATASSDFNNRHLHSPFSYLRSYQVFFDFQSYLI